MIQTFWIQFDILLQLVKKFPQLLQSAVTEMTVLLTEGRHLWLDKSRLVFSVPIRRMNCFSMLLILGVVNRDCKVIILK